MDNIIKFIKDCDDLQKISPELSDIYRFTIRDSLKEFADQIRNEDHKKVLRDHAQYLDILLQCGTHGGHQHFIHYEPKDIKEDNNNRYIFNKAILQTSKDKVIKRFWEQY